MIEENVVLWQGRDSCSIIRIRSKGHQTQDHPWLGVLGYERHCGYEWWTSDLCLPLEDVKGCIDCAG